MQIEIIGIKERRGGDEALLEIRIGDGELEEKRELAVAAKMLFELGNIAGGELPYALSEAQFDLLEYYEKLWEAVKKAADLISYGDNSKKRLSEKLRQRGFDRDISAEAAEYVERAGLINESRQLEHSVEQLAARGYGPTRIKQELIKKGISREVISEELEEKLCEIDFDEILSKVISKKVSEDKLGSDPEGRKYFDKMTAMLVRYGFSASNVRRRLRELM